MIICQKCNFENDSSNKKCSNCGELLHAGVPDDSPSSEELGDIARTEIINLNDSSPTTVRVGMTVCGRYELVEEIGKGSFAVVYKAKDKQLDRFIALKILKLSGLTEEDRKRFAREAKTSAQLNHPNIVTVYDTGQDGNISYIAMEILVGEDLKSIIRKNGPFAISEVLKISAQMCRALDNAHSKGIVHRDIKPANIVVDKENRIKITDFGLAKTFGEDKSSAKIAITKAGTILGTLAYMSPEQIKGYTLNGLTDIYSMGAVIYELTCGKPPFVAEKPLDLLKMHTDDIPLPLSEACQKELPEGFSDIVMKCLEKDRKKRFKNAGEIAVELEKIASKLKIDTSIRTQALDSSSSGTVQTVEELCGDAFIGQIVRDCEILEILGEGGMAAVYKARHTQLGTYRAIKVIKPELASQHGFYDRFKNEAILAESLSHPNLVTLYDFSKLDNGSLFTVWEYVEGENLEQHIKKYGAIGTVETVRIMKKVCDGLNAAHSKGIVHRDISPDNIMLIGGKSEGRKEIKIIDLGIAKDTSLGKPSDSHLTEIGVFVGKIGYSSPEQLGDLKKGETLDHRTDIFSVGILLYKMLLAEMPFDSSSVTAYMRELAVNSPEAMRKKIGKRIPEELREVIIKCLMTDREERYQTIKEVKVALDRALLFLTGQEKSPAKKRSRAVRTGLTTLLLIILLGAVLYKFRDHIELPFLKTSQPPVPEIFTSGKMKEKLTGLIDNANLAIKEKRLDSPENNNALYYASEIVELTGIPELGAKITDKVSDSFTKMADNILENPDANEDDIRKAEELFQKAFSHNKENQRAKSGIYLAEGRKYLVNDVPESAIEKLERALKTDSTRTEIPPLLAQVHHDLSDYYAGINRIADADSHMKKARKYNPNLKKNDFQVTALKKNDPVNKKPSVPSKQVIKKSPVKVEVPDIKKAEISPVKKPEIKTPEDHIQYNNSAKALFENKEYGKAEELYRKALKLKPDDPKIHANLGVLYYKQKLYAQSAESYKRAIQLAPSMTDANFYLARCYQELGDYTDAKYYFKIAAEQSPDDPIIYFQMGKVGEKLGDNVFAEESYLEAIKKGYKGPEAHINLGRMYFDKNNFEMAVKHFSEAVNIDGSNYLSHFNLALAFIKLNNIAEAEKHFLRTVDLNPENYNAYYQLGNIYFKNNNMENAEFNYKKAVTLNPDYAEAHFNLGIVYTRKGADKLAETHLRKSCELGYATACNTVRKKYGN